MGVQLPQTAADWLPLLVPIASLLIGLAYFLAPVATLNHIGINGSIRHPEGIGEGRSSFAGFPIGLGAAALLFQQPLLLMLLGLAFAISSLGKAVHVIFDGARMLSVLLRLIGSIGLAVLALAVSGVGPPNPSMPATREEGLVVLVGAITLVFGLLCLLAPRRSLATLRLVQAEDRPAAHGELRGTMAGFLLAGAIGVLLYGGLFVQLAVGLGWLATAFGRMISMLSEKSGNAFNWLSLLFDLTMAAIPLAVVFNLL